MRTNFVLPVVFVVFIQMLSILVLLPSHVAYEAIAEESAVLADWYGTSVADWTVATANDKYQSAFIDSGFREWGQERFTVRTETDNALGNRIGKIFNALPAGCLVKVRVWICIPGTSYPNYNQPHNSRFPIGRPHTVFRLAVFIQHYNMHRIFFRPFRCGKLAVGHAAAYQHYFSVK